MKVDAQTEGCYEKMIRISMQLFWYKIFILESLYILKKQRDKAMESRPIPYIQQLYDIAYVA